tara:strand:+ start:73 stop:501 length:429 start_codon:yes stop_codon:yes gene_type:complete
MIKYKLICKDCENTFDSWFASSSEFEKLKKKCLLSCHFCESLKIDKSLMTPSVVNKNKFLEEKSNLKKYTKIKKKINEYQKFIKKNFDFVGENFAYEARAIHYKNKSAKKGIYGSASKKEIQELKEEGIETQTIPWIDSKDN